MAQFQLNINGKIREVNVDPTTPILWVLRDHLKLVGTKYGCGIAQCGTCTIHLDGVAMRSCVLPVHSAAGKEVTTLEGLGTPEIPHPLQAAFVELQALQCGYCASGIITTAAAFLEKNSSPSDDEIKQALSGHLCRCGAQPRMVKAVARAASRLHGDET